MNQGVLGGGIMGESCVSLLNVSVLSLLSALKTDSFCGRKGRRGPLFLEHFLGADTAFPESSSSILFGNRGDGKMQINATKNHSFSMSSCPASIPVGEADS
jgi:hypothetical protein